MSKHQPAQRLAQFLPYQLSIASNAVSTRIAEQYRKRFALKTTEWRIMAVLGDHGTLTQRQLSQQTLMDKVPVNRACKRLEERVAIERRDHITHVNPCLVSGTVVHECRDPCAAGVVSGALLRVDRDPDAWAAVHGGNESLDQPPQWTHAEAGAVLDCVAVAIDTAAVVRVLRRGRSG